MRDRSQIAGASSPTHRSISGSYVPAIPDGLTDAEAKKIYQQAGKLHFARGGTGN